MFGWFEGWGVKKKKPHSQQTLAEHVLKHTLKMTDVLA